MSMRWLLASVAFPLLISTAAAQQPTLEARVDELARRFEYSRAAALIEDFLGGEPTGSSELPARALLVTMYASAGERDAARDAAAALFRRDPGYPVPAEGSLPPRIRDLFAEARAAAAGEPDELPVSLRRTGDQLELAGSVPDGHRIVDRAVLAVDVGGGFVPQEMEPVDGRFLFVIRRGGVADLRYHVRLITPHGFVVARAGTGESPLTWREPAVRDEPGERAGEPGEGAGDPGERAGDPGERAGEPGSGLGWWLLGGGVLAAGIAVALILLLAPSGAEPTIPDGIVVP